MCALYDEFYNEIEKLVDKYTKQGLSLKITSDDESSILCIFGQNTGSLQRAKKGLDDLRELAYATAEHHPYWGILFYMCQIAGITLEKWETEISRDELDQIVWSLDEIRNIVDKLKSVRDK